jgi:hypothetical protein
VITLAIGPTVRVDARGGRARPHATSAG